MSFLGIGVCAWMVASLSLLKTWTIRHPPIAFSTQNTELDGGDRLTRTWPPCRRPSKKASIAST
ncbi:hypothetical protein PR003_g18144 [Phytophthora rubi]|uniref:RxLR effector protein n=1 Tax=Phytophthora rubi TaxID=129364 RepID=A0A6A4E8S0_9STRA|nr:hypothetical protein PR003_g18144 [Phytophthora rubi]